MALFRRAERPPQTVLDLLSGDERVVSWADTDTDGGVVVATQYGLWWPDAEGPRRIGWEYVSKAVWRDDVLAVTEADVVDGLLLVDRPVVRVSLTVPRDLPPTVRKRVESNILERELASVPGGAVRFVARRRPGKDGRMWWAHLEPGTPLTPGTRSAIAARLDALRAAESTVE